MDIKDRKAQTSRRAASAPFFFIAETPAPYLCRGCQPEWVRLATHETSTRWGRRILLQIVAPCCPSRVALRRIGLRPCPLTDSTRPRSLVCAEGNRKRSFPFPLHIRLYGTGRLHSDCDQRYFLSAPQPQGCPLGTDGCGIAAFRTVRIPFLCVLFQ